MPIAVNCGTSGSGKTVQLKLAMQHFEKSRGKALYITFNGGVIERGGNAITASSQACDEDEIPEIRVYMRILYSAVCHHGIDDAGSFSDIAAVVVPHLKAIKRNRAIEVVRACRAILELKPEENILIAAGKLATLGKEAAVSEVSKEAVRGLKALSTASFVDHQGNRQLGALYVAYSAYNPAKGITVGSNRPVYYMPLPTLSDFLIDNIVGWQLFAYAKSRTITAFENTTSSMSV